MLHKSLSELAEGLRSGAVTAAALTEAALARQARFADTLGAYKAMDPDAARATAAMADAELAAGGDPGALVGLPVSVKDLFGVAGFPTFAGTPVRLPPAWEREGPLIQALRAQLAVILGKTHSVEIAFGGIGTNPHWPTPRNPWDAQTARVPGGSSSGAGVSLVEGSAVLAFGTDTSGSVRIPASMTGTVGLKVTYGRWPLGGIFPLSTSLDSPGILTRTVADAAYAFAALDPQHGGRPRPAAGRLAGLRIGVPQRFFWDDATPGVAEGVRRALAELERAGAVLVPFELAEADEAYDCLRVGGLAAVEVYTLLRNDLPEVLAGLDPNVAQRMAEAGTLLAHEYVQRKRRLDASARAAAARIGEEVDAVAAPTVAITPPTVEEVAAAEVYRVKNLLVLRNTSIGNLLKLCAITLPVALDGAGMPVGLQLMAPPLAEEKLLAMGLAAEHALGTAAQRLGPAPLCHD